MAADDRRMADRFAAAQASNAANKTEAEASEAKAAASEAQVDADDAEVRTAKLNLEYCEIKAPFAGRLGTVLVRKGAITKANETDLATLVQMRPIQVGFSVPERYVDAIRAGQAKAPLKVTANAAGDGKGGIIGEVDFIDNRVDLMTGTLRLKGLYTNQDERLWPGQFVDVVLTLSEEEGVVVPAEAVQASQKGRAVWVIKPDQTAEMRQVTVRRQVGDQAVLDKGVEAGETVVTDGQLRLAPGSKVEIKTAAAIVPTSGQGE
jgi:multidrug efflux system membrane fusion protein